MDHHPSDIAILGGGLSGLTLALQLRRALPRADITVLEKRKHPVPEAAFKVGESTVEVGAHYFGEVLGLKQHIQQQQLPKLGLRFFFPSGDNSRIENRLELGGTRFAPCPSYQIDRGRFENHLARLCEAAEIRFVHQATIDDIDVGQPGGRHRVHYSLGKEQQSLASRWIVDASGRRALLKRKLALSKESPHVGNAAWFRFRRHIKIDEWSTDSKWRQGHQGENGRWFSTNHLMGEGYWVWIIPLASGSTSMGIVAAEPFHSLSEFNSIEKATAWLERHEPQCASIVHANMQHLQDFQAIRHYAVECRQVFSAKRWGITGEAGFFHDPFYSPGSDFIALANTFLTDLIRRDLTGKDFRIRAFSYDRIFKRFYHGTALAYLDQYALFGNPNVAPVKILWDYMVYWSLTAFIFMQGRMCQQTIYLRNFPKLTRLGKINHFMQQFFRQWHEASKHNSASGKVDISRVPIIRASNQRLLESMNNRDFCKRFAENVAQLETLCWEIVDHSGLDAHPPYKRNRRHGATPNVFERVFESISAESRGVEREPEEYAA